jgi:branched-chain amino acid transport system ATP-binding protein
MQLRDTPTRPIDVTAGGTTRDSDAQPDRAGTGPGAQDSVLCVEDLEVRYGAALALKDVCLDVPRGQALCVLGPNGAGKSTLARVVSGLVPAISGRVRFDGVEVTGRSATAIRRAGLLHLPEGRGVFTRLSVNENLRMASSLLPRAERSSALESAYTSFPQLAKRRSQVAGTLSGGEQQMLSLSRALVGSPKLIIADEMSLGLAPLMVDQVFASLQTAREAGVAILLIEQFVHRALAFSDRCVVLSRGRVAWSGQAADAKDEVLTRYLGSTEV